MCYLYQAQDRLGPWIKEASPIWMMPHRRERDPYVSLNVANKMIKFVARGFITEVIILALISFFSVPKVTEDIHMVFDATLSGLNNSLWDTKFMLPSMGGFIMMVAPGMHMVNLYVGERFYNFQLSSVLEKYCRVDLGSYLGDKKYRKVTHICMRWVHLMMGMVLSP